jgi:hypothetical protein
MHTTVYPDWKQLLYRGTKLNTIQNLAEIANHVTHTHYPEVVCIHDPSDLNLLKDRHLVIKRGYSRRANHVWKSTKATDLLEIKTEVKETEKNYNHPYLIEYGIKPMWFGVPYIPELISKGEMHCFFIGGKLSYIVSTKTVEGEIEVKSVDRITPLCYISYVFSFHEQLILTRS